MVVADSGQILAMFGDAGTRTVLVGTAMLVSNGADSVVPFTGSLDTMQATMMHNDPGAPWMVFTNSRRMRDNES